MACKQALCTLHLRVNSARVEVSMQITDLLQSAEPDGCNQSVSHSARSGCNRTEERSFKAETLADSGKVSHILDFLDAVSQQVLQLDRFALQL